MPMSARLAAWRLARAETAHNRAHRRRVAVERPAPWDRTREWERALAAVVRTRRRVEALRAAPPSPPRRSVDLTWLTPALPEAPRRRGEPVKAVRLPDFDD